MPEFSNFGLASPDDQPVDTTPKPPLGGISNIGMAGPDDNAGASAYTALGGKSTWGDIGSELAAGGHDVGSSGFGAVSALARATGNRDMERLYSDSARAQREATDTDIKSMTPTAQSQQESMGHLGFYARQAAPLAAYAVPMAAASAVGAGPLAVAGVGAVSQGTLAAGQYTSDVGGGLDRMTHEELMRDPEYANDIAKGVSPEDAMFNKQDRAFGSGGRQAAVFGLGALAGAGGGVAGAMGVDPLKLLALTPSARGLVGRALAGGITAGEADTFLGAQVVGQNALTQQTLHEQGAGPAPTLKSVTTGIGPALAVGAGIGFVGGAGFHFHEGIDESAREGSKIAPARAAEPGKATAVGSSRDGLKPEAKSGFRGEALKEKAAGVVDALGNEQAAPPQNEQGVEQTGAGPVDANIAEALGAGAKPHEAPLTPSDALGNSVTVTPESRIPQRPPVEQPGVAEPVQPRVEPAQDQQGRPPAGITPAPVPPPPPLAERPSGPLPRPSDTGVVAEPDAALTQQHADLIDRGNPREAMVYPQGVQPIEITGKNKSRYGQQPLDDGRVIQYDRSGPSKLSKSKIEFADKNNRLNEILHLSDVNKDVAQARTDAGATPVAVTTRTPEGTEIKAGATTLEHAQPTIDLQEATKGAPERTVQVEHPADTVADRFAKAREENIQKAQAQTVQPTGRTLESVLPEDQAKAAHAIGIESERARTVEEQLAARRAEVAAQEKAAKVAQKEGKHWTKEQITEINRTNKIADNIAAAHPAGDYGGDATKVFAHAKELLDATNKAQLKLPDTFGEGHPYNPNVLRLREAYDLIASARRGQDAFREGLGRFLEREHLIETNPEEAFSSRRAEGAAMMGLPEGAEPGMRVSPKGGAVDEEGRGEARAAHIEQTGLGEIAQEGKGGSEEEEHVEEEPRERPKIELKEGEGYTAGKPKVAAFTVQKTRRVVVPPKAKPPVPDIQRQSIPEQIAARKEAMDKAESDLDLHGPKTITTRHDNGTDVDIKTDSSTKVKDLLSKVDYTKFSPELRPMMKALVDRMIKVVGHMDVYWAKDAEMAKTGQRSYGQFVYSKGHILLNNEVDHPNGAQATSIHEVLHAAISEMYRKYPEFRDHIDQLQREAVSQWTENLDKDYGFSEAERNAVKNGGQEFLVELMSNPAIQDLFKKFRISSDLAKKLDIATYRKASLWTGMLSAIRNAFGMPQRYVSVIEAGMNIVETGMHEAGPVGKGELIEYAGRWSKARAGELGPLDKIAGHRVDTRMFDNVFGSDAHMGGPVDFRRIASNPQQEGDKLKKANDKWTDKLGNTLKSVIVNEKPTMRVKLSSLASEPQMYDMEHEKFQHGASDPLRDRLDAMQKLGPRAEKLMEQGHELGKDHDKLTQKYGPDVMADAENVMRIANEFKVHPDAPLGVGKNGFLKNDTLENAPARGAHPELSAMYDKLPEEVQQHILKAGDYYKDRGEMLAENKARMYLGNTVPPAGKTTEQMIKRMLAGKLTEDDIKHYEAKGIKYLQGEDFVRSPGPYYYPARIGDMVVEADHEVPTPKGSDKDLLGNTLDDNVRRFKTWSEAKQFLADTKMTGRIEEKHFFDDADGKKYVPAGEIKQGPPGGPNITPQSEYRVTVQNHRVEFSKTMSDALMKREQLEKAGVKNLTQVEDRRGKGTDDAFTSSQTRELLNAVKDRKDLSDLERNNLENLIRETATISQNGNRITKTFVKSNKVQGAEYGSDAIRKYSAMSSRYLAHAEIQPEISKAFDRMQEVIKNTNDKDSTRRSEVFNDLSQRSYNNTPESLYHTYSPAIQKLMQATFIQDMASLSHIVTHEVNMHYMAGAIIGPRHGTAATFKSMYDIMREAGGPWMAAREGFKRAVQAFNDPLAANTSVIDMMRAGIKGDTRKSVIDRLVESGHIPTHSGLGLDVDPLTASKGTLNKLSQFIQNTTGAFDQMSRVVTGMNAYDLEYAKLTGLPIKERDAAALKYARNVIEQGLVHYGPGMRAKAFSTPMMRVITQFRMPGTNLLYLYGRAAYSAFRSADPAVRREAWWRLGALMVGGWALAGSSGLPTEPLKVIEMLGNQLGITPSPSVLADKFETMLADNFGTTVAKTMMDGPLSLAGPFAPSFAGRVANSALTFGEPRSDKIDDFKAWLENYSAGAVGTMGFNMFAGAQKIAQGDPAGAMKLIMPKGIADLARDYQIFQGPDAPDLFTPGGIAMAFMQGIGLRPQPVVREAEGKAAYYAEQRSNQEQKNLILKQAGQGGFAKAWQAANAWNRENPNDRITPAQLQRAVRSKGGPSIMGVPVTRKNLKELQEKQRVYQ